VYVLLDVSFYLRYLCRLIKPVVTAKALFHEWLSGFHFEDVWKASVLTEDVYPRPVRYNIFYMGWGSGFQIFKQIYFSLFEF